MAQFAVPLQLPGWGSGYGPAQPQHALGAGVTPVVMQTVGAGHAPPVVPTVPAVATAAGGAAAHNEYFDLSMELSRIIDAGEADEQFAQRFMSEEREAMTAMASTYQAQVRGYEETSRGPSQQGRDTRQG